MVPNGWEKGTLNDIASTVMGYAFKSEDFIENGIPLLRMGNLYQNSLDLNRNPVYLPEYFEGEYERFLVKPGDLVMSMTGTIGKRDYGFTVEIPQGTKYLLLNQRVLKIVPKKSVSGYILNLLRSELILSTLYSFPGGTKQANLSAKQVQELPVLIPPLPEQKKIAQILSAWDSAISVTEKLLTNSQQQKKALMQQLLTGKKRLLDESGVRFSGEWKKVKLGDVFEKVCNGLTYDASSLEGLPVTRIETISTGSVNFDKVGWAPDCDSTRRFKLEFGDILYSHINSLEHIGRVAYYNDEKPLYHGMNLLLLRTKRQSNSLFLFYLLNSQIGKKYAKTYAKSAVNQASISTADIKTFQVFIPEREEQQKIATVLSAADAEISTLEKKLTCLKDEKKALMQQLLTGKRRVTVDADAA
ncbi:TPA: restriction endonuclease subunit S [Klebsiella pneumoniae]|uniref:restriction endonuclease subunit S n=1 Tax=Klebsiella pneumoniae TaxID=573 RepID=UPI000CF625C5|nr:restriction endonuclease subunit S [Klebsiella pneumoniae]MCP5766783.1 restriction endonuclease subunit S [Klebsiella pneumoniae]PPK03666.1 type I restriction endonuclease subunit S [Klebsiella pneumoniae]HDT4073243.1 restriction endonuclease subunit S [Klebsiella pneumoniae]